MAREAGTRQRKQVRTELQRVGGFATSCRFFFAEPVAMAWQDEGTGSLEIRLEFYFPDGAWVGSYFSKSA